MAGEGSWLNGAIASMVGGVPGVTWCSLPTTPTMVRHVELESGFWSKQMRWPTGSAPLKYSRANTSLMTTTYGGPASAVVNPRPRRSGTRIVRK
jgi:hypothetical protein